MRRDDVENVEKFHFFYSGDARAAKLRLFGAGCCVDCVVYNRGD